MNITGKEISYLYVCKRKLWFFRHGIRPELENINVQIGMHIHETTFTREEKDIPLGDVGVIDWASFKNGYIHETKKGKTPGKGDDAQVRYYLWWLNENGIQISEARIHYPKMKQTKTVLWDEDARSQTLKDIEECHKVIRKASPPPLHKYPYCKSCAYMEICFS